MSQGEARSGSASVAQAAAKDDPVSVESPARPSRWNRVFVAALVAFSYIAAACLVYWPISPFSSHTIIDMPRSDPVQEVWFLNWTAWAPLHGRNPFYTYFLHAPHGANLALNTSFPLLGAIGAPITWVAGPLVTYNVLLRLALASSAFVMYLVLRRYTRWGPAAYLGGLLYGFSPYMIGHAHRHLFLTFVPLLPLFVVVVDDWLVRMRRNPYVSGLLAGILVAAEFLISPEVALLAAGGVVVALVVLALRYRGAVRARLVPLVKGAVVLAAVALVIAGYPAYLLLRGPERPVGPIHVLSSLYVFHGDLVAPIVPTVGEWLSPTGSGSNIVHNSVQENGYYLGIPLLLLLLVAVVRCRRSALVLAAAAVGVAAFVLSLGPTLTVNGHRVVGHLPFALIAKMPVLQNIEPARMSLFVQFAAAVILAVALDRWRSGRRSARPPWLRPAGVLLVGVAVLIPLLPQLPLREARVSMPAFFASKQVDAIPPASLALTYPYSMTPDDDPMLWQIASGMRFRMFGGMAFVPGPDGVSTWTPYPPSPDIDKLLLADRSLRPPTILGDQVLLARLHRFLHRYGVQVVIVDTQWERGGEVARVFAGALGQPTMQRSGVDVWLHVDRNRFVTG